MENQLALDRVANIAIALYTSIAVISKLDRSLDGTKILLPHQELDLSTGKLYIQYALDIIEQSLNTLFHNYDAAIEQLSDKLAGFQQ